MIGKLKPRNSINVNLVCLFGGECSDVKWAGQRREQRGCNEVGNEEGEGGGSGSGWRRPGSDRGGSSAETHKGGRERNLTCTQPNGPLKVNSMTVKFELEDPTENWIGAELYLVF